MTLRRTLLVAALLSLAAAPALAQEHDAAAHDATVLYMVRAEIDVADADEGALVNWDAEAWIGGDSDKLWLKSEGASLDGDLEDAEVQILWSRNVAAFWDLQAGLRFDIEPDDTAWLAVGVQGLAPQFFETEATLFLGEDGDAALRVKQSFDILITQRLIAEPHVEFNAYAQDIPERGVGAGFADVEAGLQFRYEIARKFAPYIDVVYERALGETAGLLRAAGEDVEETTARFGVRFWF